MTTHEFHISHSFVIIFCTILKLIGLISDANVEVD